MIDLHQELKNSYEMAKCSQYNLFIIMVFGFLIFLLVINNHTIETKIILNFYILLTELIGIFLFLISSYSYGKGSETSSSAFYQFFIIIEAILLLYFSLTLLTDLQFSYLIVNHKNGLNVLFTFVFQIFSLITEILIKLAGFLNIYTVILIFILKYISLQFSYLRFSTIPNKY